MNHEHIQTLRAHAFERMDTAQANVIAARKVLINAEKEMIAAQNAFNETSEILVEISINKIVANTKEHIRPETVHVSPHNAVKNTHKELRAHRTWNKFLYG